MSSCSSQQNERQHWPLSLLDASPVYERGAFDKSLKYLRHSLLKICDVCDLKMKQLARPDRDPRHASRWGIQVSHAIIPGVHVATVKAGKAQRLREDRMKAVPVSNVLGLESDGLGCHGVSSCNERPTRASTPGNGRWPKTLIF